MTNLSITYQDLLFYGSIITVLGFFITLISNLITNRVSTKYSIVRLKELINKMPDDIKHKQDIEMCRTLHKSIDEKLHTDRQDIIKLKDDTSEIKEVVIKLDAKFDEHFKAI